MINKILFKQILSQEDEGYITPEDVIDEELIQIFAESKIEKVKKLFVKTSSLDGALFQVETTCSKCGKKFVAEMSKTRLTTEYLREIREGRNTILCDDCKGEIKRLQREQERENRENYEREKEERTQSYISNYLNPGTVWKEGVPINKKISLLDSYYVDEDVIAEHIRRMKYADFLQTPYWKAIAEKVRKKAGYRCQLCNGTNKLNVHHRTYQNHGRELHNMQDLICVCEDCHRKFHDK